MTVPTTKVEYSYATTALADGSFQYGITAFVAEAGELPHSSLFLYEITDVVDATQDAFIRVATPYDLENVLVGRDPARDVGNSYYLSSTLTRNYTDLNLAVQAKEAVKSRVNDGVRSWYDFSSDFMGDTDVYHPTADATYEVQLQDAYYAARTTRQDAETAFAASEASLVLARDAATANTAITAAYKVQLDYITRARAYWDTYFGIIQTITSGLGFAGKTKTYQTTVAQLIADADPADPLYSVWVAAYATQEANLETLSNNEISATQLTAELLTSYQSLTGLYNTSLQQATVKNNAVSAAVILKKEAEALLASALLAEDAALALALAVCPTFVPTT